jgi:hypothetical protein
VRHVAQGCSKLQIIGVELIRFSYLKIVCYWCCFLVDRVVQGTRFMGLLGRKIYLFCTLNRLDAQFLALFMDACAYTSLLLIKEQTWLEN